MRSDTGQEARRLHRVAGRSMAPFLQKGDLLRWVPCQADELRTGEIVVLRDGDRLLAHRVIAREGTRLLTMGDGNLRAEIVSPSDIAGRVVDVRRQALLMEFETGVPDLVLPIARGLRRRHEWYGRGLWGMRAAWLHRLLTRRSHLRRARAAVRETTIRESPEVRNAVLRSFRELAGSLSSADATVPDDHLMEALARHGLDVLEARRSGRVDRLRAAAFEYLAARSSIREIAPALTERGIPFIVLKGVPLGLELYGNDPVRPSADLDLLVSPEDRPQTARVLTELGWRPAVGAGVGAVLHRLHFHEAFVPSGRLRVPVELHWHLEDSANLHRLDESEVWGRRAVRDGVGRLECGDEFLYLCLHAARHARCHYKGLSDGVNADWFVGSATGARLIWYLDLHRHLQLHGGAFDWAGLVDRIERWNLGDEVATVLRVLDRLLPHSTAEAALNRLGIAPTGVVASTGPRHRGDDPPASQERALSGVIVRPARLAGLTSLLFPPSQQLRRFYRVSPLRLPVLRLWHPFRMVLRLLGLSR